MRNSDASKNLYGRFNVAAVCLIILSVCLVNFMRVLASDSQTLELVLWQFQPMLQSSDRH